MPNRLDLINVRFGRLLVIGEAEPTISSRGNVSRRVMCQCDCGTVSDFPVSSLRSGHTKSCGCFRKETTARRKTKHGMARCLLYQTWLGMKARCFRKSHGSYHNYGGRGITICKRWLESPQHFADGMGPKPDPDLTVERKDNDGHYSCGECEECLERGWPSNCEWATRKVQSNNNRRNVRVMIDGETVTAEQCGELVGIDPNRIRRRAKNGRNNESCVTSKHLGRRYLKAFGKEQTVAEWGREYGIAAHIIYGRLNRRKWSVERAISEPLHENKRNKKSET